MGQHRSGFLFIGLAALTLALAGPAAAKPRQLHIAKVSVRVDAGTAPITARWRTDRTLRRGQAYKVELATGGGPDRNGPPCGSPQIDRVVGRGTRRGTTITVRFPVPKVGRWCATSIAGVRVTLAGDGTLVGQSDNVMIPDHRGLAPSQTSWVQMTLDPASSITVKVPGRPDRSAPLSAAIDQDTLGPAQAADTLYTNASGTLTPGPLPADLLCTAAPIAPIDVDRATTTVVGQTRSDNTAPVSMTLVLHAGAAALTGCAADGPAAATTAIVLSGSVSPATTPPGTLPLTGTLDGVRLAGGGVATVAFDVRLKQGYPLPAST